jgi:amino acid transporter
MKKLIKSIYFKHLLIFLISLVIALLLAVFGYFGLAKIGNPQAIIKIDNNILIA